MSRGYDELVHEAIATPFTGWDFSFLDGRMIERSPTWDLGEIARRAAAGVSHALDIDTGGGEFLTRLLPIAAWVVATEGWAPNFPVATDRLRPLRVPLVASRSAPDNVEQQPGDVSPGLPFRDGSFQLVMNRHSSYLPSEVFRVLGPGGAFVTQQVSMRAIGRGTTWERLFGRPEPGGLRYDAAFAADQLRDAGFTIEAIREEPTPEEFLDVGALAYYLKATPWTVPGFDPQTHGDELRAIHRTIEREGVLVVQSARMLIEALR